MGSIPTLRPIKNYKPTNYFTNPLPSSGAKNGGDYRISQHKTDTLKSQAQCVYQTWGIHIQGYSRKILIFKIKFILD